MLFSGLVLANSILQELSWVHNKSSSCSPWNGCGKGTLIPVYHQGSTQAEHGLNPEVEMLCAEHKHTGRACKACEGTETGGGGKGSWIAAVWCGTGQSTAEMGTALRASPSQLGAVTTGLVTAQHRAEIYLCLWQHPKAPLGLLWGF